MNDSDQRNQWADHLRDEADARQAQQRSAGATHEPLQGPLPFSADDLEQAVRAERERCAAIADRWASPAAVSEAFADMTEWELKAAAEVAGAIGRSIRGQGG
jgi:hypothetical protein